MAAGMRQRHTRTCPRAGRCSCPWEVSVFDAHPGTAALDGHVRSSVGSGSGFFAALVAELFTGAAGRAARADP